ncbi:hypothetical protein M9Y10_044227 [Tritrichomonas musculus]|uniref:Proteasome assembly chaperone 1 n=1 Tax=Tritrichomonas musculus TaxID=1915356 RepID=A0ABR2K1W9_9EUKA
MEEKVFSFVDLSEGDHEFATFKYVGDDISNKICFCAVTPSSCSLFSTLTDELNPVGFFIITINDIINTIDYANGADPCPKFVRSFRNEVFKIGEVTIVLFENPEICSKESVDAIFDLVKAEQIFVFSTISKNLFKTDTESPKLYYIATKKSEENKRDLDSQNDNESKLPFPNRLENISAGLLILGEIKNIGVRVFQLVEDPKGPTVESMSLLLGKMTKFIHFDIEKKAQQACHIANIRHSSSANIL